MLKDNIPQFIGNEPQINDLLTAIQPEIDSLRQELEIDEKQLYAITTDSQVKPKDVFNREAFTVVGSPTITDDGIASGFSAGDYVIPVPLITNGKSWSFEIALTANNFDVEQSIISSSKISNRGGIGIVFNRKRGATTNVLTLWVSSRNEAGAPWDIFSGASGTKQYEINKKYYIRFSYSNGKYKLEYSEDKISWFEDISRTSELLITTKNFSIGASPYGNNYFSGSIDLKQFSISVDGKEVFSGTKEVWQSEYMQRWERDYGLPLDLSLTIEERRNRLLNKIRRKRILNKAGLKALIKATVNDAQFHISNKPSQYKFTVYLSDMTQKEKLHKTLYYARPAHLIYDIIELIDVRRCGTFNCGSNPL